ncbi:MAG: hypothetical protein ACFCU6_02280, partial [Balneolaceae bacterium]
MRQKINNLLNESRIRYISFDVFDTIVTRKVGDPYAIFLLIGKRLLEKKMINSSPELFARSRLASEKKARRNKNHQEIQLINIYEEMFLSYSL